MLKLGSRLTALTNKLSVVNKAAFSASANKLSEYPPNGFSFGKIIKFHPLKIGKSKIHYRLTQIKKKKAWLISLICLFNRNCCV